jgi:hypothetical protein
MMCANKFYIAIRVIQISNLIRIENGLQFIKGFEIEKDFPFTPSLLGRFPRRPRPFSFCFPAQRQSAQPSSSF